MPATFPSHIPPNHPNFSCAFPLTPVHEYNTHTAAVFRTVLYYTIHGQLPDFCCALAPNMDLFSPTRLPLPTNITTTTNKNTNTFGAETPPVLGSGKTAQYHSSVENARAYESTFCPCSGAEGGVGVRGNENTATTKTTIHTPLATTEDISRGAVGEETVVGQHKAWGGRTCAKGEREEEDEGVTVAHTHNRDNANNNHPEHFGIMGKEDEGLSGLGMESGTHRSAGEGVWDGDGDKGNLHLRDDGWGGENPNCGGDEGDSQRLGPLGGKKGELLRPHHANEVGANNAHGRGQTGMGGNMGMESPYFLDAISGLLQHLLGVLAAANQLLADGLKVWREKKGEEEERGLVS